MKRILIVEDVELNRDLLVQLLEDEYEILTALDGAAGVELARREHPDLVLMDLSLPVMDGWEATRRLEAEEATCAIPVIALSSFPIAQTQGSAYAAGCRHYMEKQLSSPLAVLQKVEEVHGRPPSPGEEDSPWVLDFPSRQELKRH